MNSTSNIDSQVITDFIEGCVLASVEIAAPPERVFLALTTKEIIDWWVRPGVFETKDWSGDVRAGGRWKASGLAGGNPWVLEGEFIEFDPPRKLAHTWHFENGSGPVTIVTYTLEPIAGGTRLVLKHSGFPGSDAGSNVSAGWRTSFERLAEILSIKVSVG